MTAKIEVYVRETGDLAECDSPEAAVTAALTIGEEARGAAGAWGFDPTLVFEVDGKIVRTSTLRTLRRL